jgi:cytosine/adenosine deaminase-related metal-dependent hydrolase
VDVLIEGATIVTGGPSLPIQGGAVLIDGGLIRDVIESPGEPRPENAGRIIDGTGLLAIPGIINGHCHGCTAGPLFPSGSLPLPLQKARRNAMKMLSQGVTTLINMCGFADRDDALSVGRQVPVNVRIATCHTPSSLEAALMVDGKGLEERHRRKTVFEMLEDGAAAIGEMGSGASLGGGVTEYKYIPEEIQKMTGRAITAQQAKALKEAVLGRELSPGSYDGAKTEALMEELGLAGAISTDELKEMMLRVALKPVIPSLQSFDEACGMARDSGAPVVFHNSLVSAEKILELCRKYGGRNFKMVAAHCNHPSFTPAEAVRYARLLKEAGAVIDVSSLDCIITRWMNGPENIEALAGEGLIDTISTDYGGGYWDGILETVHYLVNRGLTSLPRAVAMATSAPAGVFPLAARNRGLIEKGRAADIVLCDSKNPGRVETVIIGGKIVLDGGFPLPL